MSHEERPHRMYFVKRGDSWQLAPGMHTTRPVDRPRTPREVAKRVITPAVRGQVIYRDGQRCTYCQGEGGVVNGPDGQRWNIDHETPLKQGGTNELDNLRLACRACNRAKGARTPEQWQRPRLRT